MIHLLPAVATIALGAGTADAKLSFDRFGGWKAVRFERGRFFRTHYDGKRWWLVTPEGHGFLSIGACCVQPTGSYIRGTTRYPYKEGVLAKHGDVATWAKVARRRMRQWGFNTMACWSGREVRETPRADILSMCSGAGGNWLTGELPDFFDPKFHQHVRKKATQCRRHRDDPWLIGYFLDNEMAWDHDWRMAPNLFERYLTLPAEAAGKQAWCRILRERYKTRKAFNQTWSPSIKSWDELAACKKLTPLPDRAASAQADRQAFVLMAVREYFRTCTEAIRAEDPHHLILGCRFVSWVAPRMAVKACGEFCDVVSINFYELGPVGHLTYARWRKTTDYVPGQPDMTGFYELARKPLLITEFGFRSKDSGLPNTYPPALAIQPLVATQKIRGERYAKYVKAWMGQPFFVGYHWFRWMDEPKEGRFDGENGNYGLVDIRDEPYDVFVKAVTRINRDVWPLHRGSTMPGR